MPVVHLAAVDALQGQALGDQGIHIHGHRLVADAQQADLAAITHHGDHLLHRHGHIYFERSSALLPWRKGDV